jgi:hypothetical protein
MVCQYEKKHRDFRYRLMRSTYFDPNGTEAASEVLAAFGSPFGTSTFYQHMNRHRHQALIKAQIKFDKAVDRSHKADPKALMNAVEGDVLQRSEHELALKEIVTEGRAKLAAGDMTITLTGMINASKALADIDKSTKDRRMDAVKTMFKGIVDESGTSTEG